MAGLISPGGSFFQYGSLLWQHTLAAFPMLRLVISKRVTLCLGRLSGTRNERVRRGAGCGGHQPGSVHSQEASQYVLKLTDKCEAFRRIEEQDEPSSPYSSDQKATLSGVTPEMWAQIAHKLGKSLRISRIS